MAVRAAFRCQTCKNPLEFEGVPESLDSRTAGFGAAARLDDSFIVLPDGTRAGAQGGAAAPGHAPRVASVSVPPSGRVPFGDSDDITSPVRQPAPGAPAAAPHRAMDESFVVLPSTASVMRSHAAPSQPPASGSAPSSPPAKSGGDPGEGLVARFQAVAKIWDMASNEAAVDHPLCRDCAAALRKELEQQVAEAEADCAAYETLLEELREQEAAAPPSAAFERELQQLDAAAADEEAKLAADLAALATAEAALAAAKARSRQLDEAEAAHEADVEEHELQVAALDDDVAALEARIRAANAQLDLLRRTHVFNEAFHIWHDGPFGTISGFRLGRTAAQPVEWEEINAAWGQACLLLSTMAQVARVTFASHTLLPMGSTPRVRDAARGGTYDLFGPVNPLNLLAAQRFDKAQVGFLACLAEFAAFAAARDAAAGVAEPFHLPYALDADKVDGRSVRFTMNRDDKWTAALKLVLTDLKVMLSWLSSQYLDTGERGA